MYCEQNIRKELSGYNVNFIIRDEVSSTNDELMLLGKEGEKEVTVMLTESQTGGKGRMGRTFHSPKDSGIYMSILLRPTIKPEDCNLLTPMTAVAAARAIEKTLSVKTDIKWANDLYCEGKKVGGILTKAAFSSVQKTDYAVVGIGINLTEPKEGFHEDIKDIASALKKEVSLFERDKLVGVFLREFLTFYEKLTERQFFSDYRKRLLYLGEKITVREKESFYKATAVDIDEDFRLIVRLKDGSEKALYFEEISIRTKE